MTIFRYKLIESCCRSAELGQYISYGIAAERETEGRWTVCAQIDDISCSSGIVRAMAERFTCCQLALVHLPDAVADALP